VEKAIYLWMWLQSPRWLIPKVAQPQIPPSKSQKWVKLVSVCALTQQVWEAGGKKRVGCGDVVGIVIDKDLDY
jgi:hypothetical protein